MPKISELPLVASPTTDDTVALVDSGTTSRATLATLPISTATQTALNLKANSASLGTMSTQNATAVAITGGSVTGITDITVADGGTGASTAAGARTSLGAAVSGANNDITSMTVLSVGGLPAGTVTPTTLSQPFTAGTAQSTASGTQIEFLSLPSWIKRITLLLSGVSTTSTNNFLIILGDSGGFEITGYVSSVAGVLGTNSCEVYTSSTGFALQTSVNAAALYSGAVVIEKLTGTTWIATSTIQNQAGPVYTQTGVKTLSGTLDRVALSASGNTFDAGTINIFYE